MIWISLTVMILTIALSTACLRDWRGDALGIPLIAIGSFAFLYVIQPTQLLPGGTYGLFLTDWQMSKGFLVSALMLACYMWGWLYPNQPRRLDSGFWDSRLLWRVGFVTACIGLVLYIVFLRVSGGFVHSYSQAHGQAMAWQTNTAYLYDGPWLMLSGSVMMFLGEPTLKLRRWNSVAPYAFLSVFFLSAILTGSRESLFASTTTFFVGSSIVRRRKVGLWQAMGVLLLVGVGVLAMLGYRNFLHLGERPSEDLPSVESVFNNGAGVSEYDKEHDAAAQEFIVHAVTLDTVDQTGKLDYGIGWIEFLIINPIPRLIWPDKAMPQPIGVTWGDIREHTSLNIASGSACGIVADLYQRFHLLSVFFFFFLGFGLRRLFIAARSLSSPVTVVGYVMVYAFSLTMYAQGFSATFVPLAYSMVPVVLYSWVTKESRRKAKLRQRALILQQVAALNGAQWSSSRS